MEKAINTNHNLSAIDELKEILKKYNFLTQPLALVLKGRNIEELIYGIIIEITEYFLIVGDDTTGEIMNIVPWASIDHIKCVDNTSLFSLKDLFRIDYRQLQMVTNTINYKDLVIALKYVDEAIIEYFCNSMSSNWSKRLREDLDTLKSVTYAEAYAAQRRIIKIANSFLKEGRVILWNKENTKQT